MKIAIRLDDITPGMNRERFERFRRLLDARGIQPLIGVIPACQDPKLSAVSGDETVFWQDIRGLVTQGWTVSMHGLNHVYRTEQGGLFPLNRQSEFAGLPYREQLSMLQQGRETLADRGIQTDIFMAPSHSYDRATLRGLRAAGFRYVTDGFGRRPYTREGLTFLPISLRRGSVLKNECPGYTTFVVHTDAMTDDDFAWYERVFAAYGDRFISYHTLLELVPRSFTPFQAVTEPFLAGSKRLLVRLRSGVLS
ncbi:MAG: DUF2334 domain-containing protein [Butyrivibrio sp.]|nr:DUF2334 domain-containing protein [Butyrivibrio sp.]